MEKCKVITFSRSQVQILHSYHINKFSLTCVHDISDLGVIFDPTLSFNKHILHITSKSSKILGFIIRNSKDFIDTIALKTLFTSLVRENLEYNSVVWSPYIKHQIHCLDNV